MRDAGERVKDILDAIAAILAWAGRDIGVTFDPVIADAHPDTLRLLTFDDRVLDDLLAVAAKQVAATGKVARLITEVGPRRLVGWYGVRDGKVLWIEWLADLKAVLAASAPAGGEWIDEARRDFEGRVSEWVRRERSAVQEEAPPVTVEVAVRWVTTG